MASAANTKTKFWPTPQDYNEAVQNPHLNLGDEELQQGTAETSALGLPQPITGSFASVYRMHCGALDRALRCFLRDIPDTQWRYGRIADFLSKTPLPYTVDFKFQFKGIRIGAKWYPALKMDWVEGQTLDNYLRDQIATEGLDERFSEIFKQMCLDLEHAGIAHGDLQHGNIIVQNQALKLVDYDGMYVPHIDSPHSNELGHRNYQHPKRTAQHFGVYLDHFSSWVIYASLKALSLDGSLFERLGAGEDCLLFRRQDFVEPCRSCAFAALESHPVEEIQTLARIVRSLLDLPVENVPPLNEPPVVPQHLPPLHLNTPSSRTDALPATASEAFAEEVPREFGKTVPTSSFLAGSLAAAPSKTQAHVQVPIETALLKPVPRRVELNPNNPTISPAVLQLGILLIPVFFLLFLALEATGSKYISVRDVLGMMASIGLPIVVVLSPIVWWKPLRDRRIVQQGKAVRGRIIEKRVDRKFTEISVNGRSMERMNYQCKATYEYPFVQNGKVTLDRETVDLSYTQYHFIDENEEVTIVYLPNAGGHSKPQSLLYKFSSFRAK